MVKSASKLAGVPRILLDLRPGEDEGIPWVGVKSFNPWRTTSEMEALNIFLSLKQYMANASLARLVGHAFGDGNIHKYKFYFIYTNSNEKLRKMITNIIEKEFKKFKITKRKSGKGIPQLQFSVKIGRKIIELGGIAGSKVRQITKIPVWIKNGDNKIKANFLAAILDDEGYFRDTKGSKQIVLKFSKIQHLENNLDNFLQEIRQLFLDLNIRISEVKKDQIKSNKRREIIVSKRIWITGRENFIRFREKIPIAHPDKLNKLSNLCS